MDNNNFELPKRVDETNSVVNNQVQEKKENIAPNMINELKESVKVQKGSLIKFFKDAFKYLTTRNSKELFELLWRLAMIAIFILLLYVPVQLVQDLLLDFLISVGVEMNERMQGIYLALFNGTYSLVALVLFFIICKERFYKFVNEGK